MNGFRPKSDRELSDYQKRIEAIDNVILCVAEAEKMFRDIGMSLISESELAQRIREHRARQENSSRLKCGKYYM
ncbi:MAG: hypothetical protein V1792_25275 [Pseudomonadota bacterium]